MPSIFSYFTNATSSLSSLSKDSRGILQHAHESCRADKNIVLLAVQYYGKELSYASADLQDDEEVVRAAIAQYGYAYRYASRRLQSNKEIALLAVSKPKGNVAALQHMPQELQKDRDIIRTACDLDRNAVSFLPDELKDNEELMLELARMKAYVHTNCSKRLLSSKAIALESVTHYPYSLEIFHDSMKDDKDVVLTAISNGNGTAFSFASQRLKGDKQLVEEAIKNGGTLDHAAKRLKDDKEFIEYVAANYPTQIRYASPRLRAIREIALLGVKADGNILVDLSRELQGDKEIVMIALQTAPKMLAYASSELREDKEVVTHALQVILSQKDDQVDVSASYSTSVIQTES